MSNIVPFEFEGSAVRVIKIDGEPWFVARDVVEAIGGVWKGVSGSTAHVPDQWKGVRSVQTPGGIQQMAILAEQGVYFYLARSDKPKALPIQMWLAGEVLPSIRKTGASGAPALPDLSDPVLLVKLLTEHATKRIELEKKVAVLEPKAAAYDRLANEAEKTAEAVREQVRVITHGLTKLAKLVPERLRPVPQPPTITPEEPSGADTFSVLAFRVRSLVNESGEAPSVIARKWGFGKDYIRDIIIKNPRKKSFSYEGLMRLAIALDCDVEYLTLQQDTPRRKETAGRPLLPTPARWRQ